MSSVSVWGQFSTDGSPLASWLYTSEQYSCILSISLIKKNLILFWGIFLQFQASSDALPCQIHFFCMLVNHGPSQQSSNIYKPWKWGVTARYYTSHAKTMLPTRKSVPRSGRQSGHTKTSWSSERDANWSGMDRISVHRVWPKPFSKAQWKGEEDKTDGRRGGKTTLGNGQDWSSQGLRGRWRTEKNGEGWLWSHLWCQNDPCS